MNKNEIEIGDLCLHYNIPVIVLERNWGYSSFIKEGQYSYICLLHNNTKSCTEGSLRKL